MEANQRNQLKGRQGPDATQEDILDQSNVKRPGVKARHDEESDYSEDFAEGFEQAEPSHAQQVRQHQESKVQLKQARETKAKGGGGYVPEEEQEEGGVQATDEDLDDRWTRIKDFINDMAQDGVKQVSRKAGQATRLRLLESFETHDPQRRGSVSLRDLQQTFTAARFSPALTDSQWDRLITALEVWEQREVKTVNYQRLMAAPHQREAVSQFGIFPKVIPKGPSKFEMERKAKAEEEERKKAEQLEEEKKRRDLAMRKSAAGSRKQSPGKRGGGPSKEEIRRLEKEKQQKVEQEKREAEQLQKEEDESVKRQVASLKGAVASIQAKSRGLGLRDIFRMHDTDRSGSLDRSEFNRVLAEAKCRLGEQELENVFRLVDKSGDGRIGYKEFCNVIEGIVTPDYMEFIKAERQRDRKQGESNLAQGFGLNIQSRGADMGSEQISRDDKLGRVEGLSGIMQRSTYEQRSPPRLMDDGQDILRVQGEIKELLRTTKGKPTTFDDLLSLMGGARFQKEGQVSLADFQAVVKGAGAGNKFSVHEVKQVFSQHSIEPPKSGAYSQIGGQEAYIPLREFKDKFLPSMGWQKDNVVAIEAKSTKEDGASVSISKTESMDISQIMQGKQIGDVMREREEQQRKLEKLKQKNQKLNEVSEQSFDLYSQDSRISKPIEQVVGTNPNDPRKKYAMQQAAQAKKNLGGLNQSNLRDLDQQVNDQYYRQPEAVMRQVPGQSNFELDKSLDRFFRLFCTTLVIEANEGPKQRDVESYVDHYGKESAGFLHYGEFKHIFETHALHALEEGASPPEEGKLSALFSLFDVTSRGKIARQDFVATLNRIKPAIGLIERLGNKVRKGGDRLMRALTEEFQEADAPFGCNGQLPLNNFQVILADYDVHIVKEDLTELEKRGYVFKDELDCRYVDYAAILQQARPKQISLTGQSGLLVKAAIRIQSSWRASQARREVGARRLRAQADLAGVGAAIDALEAGDPDVMGRNKGSKGSSAKTPEEKAKDAVRAKNNKSKAARATRDRQRENDTLEGKMGGIVGSGKASKTTDKSEQARREMMADYIRNTVLDYIVESAFCYGESLGTCRTIQKRFETRPVTKFLFPLIQEFSNGVQGVLPKSLQTVSGLGRVLCLDAENQLNLYDVASLRSIQAVNLGTRPPLRHYPIIDMVCDQVSGRIYTLNANWILEIWSMEQGASFPQKRLAVCANEGGKDFRHLYYTQTFYNAKPRFLSLQESNQQILVVNTSCVDGSIVFIDPISFSVLKKIQLRYSDYEVPKAVRDSIQHLQNIFDKIREKDGLTVVHIFADITHRDTQEVKIRDFVTKLIRLDTSLVEEDLFKCCRALDADGSGSITLDEFLEFFGHLEKEAAMSRPEDGLDDGLWPEWLVKEGKVQHAQQLLTKIHAILETEHGITAEQAFGIYDVKDTGECTVEEFSRVMEIFFGEVLPTKEDLDFIKRLAPKRGVQRVDYREFCKYLGKKVIRAFKSGSAPGDKSGDGSSKEVSASVTRELERPLIKEASLTYILRKAAELDLDLRKVLLDNDRNELNVIPRTKFVGLLLEWPLGLNEVDVQEILENDLSFDNYGNVDYTVILNSDLFCHLERQRLKAGSKKGRRGKGVQIASAAMGGDEPAGGAQAQGEADQVDNRKVVVEDLLYIDDLEILIYTTVAPKTSSVFITSVKKTPTGSSKKQEVEVITLETVGQQTGGKKGEGKPQESQSSNLLTNYYQLLAKLKGHRNSDPPSICYVPQSCCLITGEKHLDEAAYGPAKSSFPSASDPTVPASHKFQKSNEDAYVRHNARGQQGSQCEILIWNLQRDLIELFQSRPPWNVPCHKRVVAHNSSIVDICYMSKAQLVVTASTDQTIKFFDPVSTSYELTDPGNNPHAQMRPGHYRPLQREQTRSNVTFKEVKRIYTGNETSCFSLRCLSIPNIASDPQNPGIKSQIEWIVALKLGRPQFSSGRNTQVGYVTGYGVERVQIEVPALHHDDIVPPFIMKECEELITQRRRKLIASFRHNLEQTISKIRSQVQLQESYMNKVRALFMQAILQRKEIKYVNPEPLREIYKLILKLPDRTKFQSFLASSGCSDKLSVSETFFYLQKFQQIHPLRTTQIEFERSIQEFHDKHQRQFLKGIKRWPKKSVQKFADHLRRHGLDLVFLQTGNGNGKQFSSFCTRERFLQYFEEFVSRKGDRFTDLEIDSILNDLDPFYTGVIQLRLVQKVYHEEIQFYKRTSLSRPNEILEDIRTLVFPNKRVALQQALAQADDQGDGYLQLPAFVGAFQRADVGMDRDTLEFLFDIMSESYTMPKTDYEPQSLEEEEQTVERVVPLDFFMSKLFQQQETRELDEVELTLANIKAALIYKGLDFSIIFAEQSEDAGKKPKRQVSKKSKEERAKAEQERKEAAKAKEQNIDMTMHYSRFAQQRVREEFCRRVESLQAPNVTPEKIHRLATFLALNQKNQQVIYLNSWLHHLRRANTTFQEPDKRVLPLMCARLLKNERVFRSWLESGGISGTIKANSKRDEDKVIQLVDLRHLLAKFGISYVNQGLFLKEFTKGDQVHVDSLMAQVKQQARQHFQATGQSNAQELPDPTCLVDLRKTDYFRKFHESLSTNGGVLDNQDLLRQFRDFDAPRTGYVKVYQLINIIKHNHPNVFSDDCLVGLQFSLECLSEDGTVEYEEFIKSFLVESASSKPATEIRLDTKSPYNLQDYEDLLGKIQSHVTEQGLDLGRIFTIMCKQGGIISFEGLAKILKLIEFNYTDNEFELIQRYADESNQGTVHAYDFLDLIRFSKQISPSFDVHRWIVASRELQGRYKLLEMIQVASDQIKDNLLSRQTDQEAPRSNVITAQEFDNLLTTECSGLVESDKYILCRFAIKGSRRPQGGEQPSSARVDMKRDCIQYDHFDRALGQVIEHMRQEVVAAQQDRQDESQNDQLAKFRQQMDEELERQQRIDAEHFGSAQSQRMGAMKQKVVALFQERDVTFFDCFHSLYDPLNPSASIISIGDFKQRVRQLNLPLSVQEHRLLRRIADPRQLGKVDIKKFCGFFETPDLRQRRLHKILDKVATAFFLQGFNMRRAFALFDADGDGAISAKEFRQGMAALNLHLRYDEIDDLMRLCDQGGDGVVQYDEFISRMDLDIKHRSGQVMVKVEEAFFEKLGQAMEYSRETLYDIMQGYDLDGEGTIEANDLPKVIKKLGIMNPDPHMHHVLMAGCGTLTDKRIDFATFSMNLEAEVTRRKRESATVYEKQLEKIAAILRSREITLFEFFVMLDVNQSGTISRLEFKTGVQAIGLSCSATEFEALWSSIHRPVQQIQHEAGGARGSARKVKRLEPGVEQVDFLSVLNTFARAGILKLQSAMDHQDSLLSKFRTQLQKCSVSVEKAYKILDPMNCGSVQRTDFLLECPSMGLQFSEEELNKLFESICDQGGKKKEGRDTQSKDLDAVIRPTTYTRFTYKQLYEAVLVPRDENWLFQSCIKIHSVTLQKGLSYKRLFNQWRDKDSKTTAGRLNERELANGLKKLKAGLTQDEIDKLCSSLQYDGKDLSIAALGFEKAVTDNARKLESERSFQRMILQDWIVQFNECLNRERAPLDRLFREHDLDQVGALNFEDFSGLNEQLGLAVSRKDLQQVFDILDRQRTKRVRLEDLKGVASLLPAEDGQEQDLLALEEEEGRRGLTGVDLARRQELDDIYLQVKETLETRNVTLDAIVYNELKYMAHHLATTKGIQQVFERLEIILARNEAERILNDVRKSNQGKFECSFKHFIDFMTRKRINVAFVDKGFIDPLIASVCQQFAKAKDIFGLTFDQVFDYFVGPGGGEKRLTKEDFLSCAQGLELDIAIEDLRELFNFMDEKKGNAISKVQFVDALTFVTNKLGGGSALESMGKGMAQAKKGSTNRQAILNILNNVADSIYQKQLQMRHVIQILDVNKIGYITRAEFSRVVRGLCESISLDQARKLEDFFDERRTNHANPTGRISVAEVVAILQELINQQIGGGVYARMQVSPVIRKIINQLAIDADKFFDEVAYLNDAFLKQESKTVKKGPEGQKKKAAMTQDQMCGLSKRLFFGQLQTYGVPLSEQEKALICQVFSLDDAPDKLDYLKLDQALEGEQQHMYALGKFYTVEWERRIFKKIGDYLKQHDITIADCFDLIDNDKSDTISLAELKLALVRFGLGLSDKQVKIFLERLCDPGQTFISRDAFIKRFWSAYTYDLRAADVESEETSATSGSSIVPDGGTAADRGRIATGLQQKLKGLRMLRAIQERLKKAMTVSEAFTCLDSGVGFLTLQDFQVGLSRHFDLTLKQHEVAALFQEVDSDGNGVVKYGELDQYYRMDYQQRVQELEMEKERMVTQYDIFDHLLKVLKQKGLTLEEMFDQIDVDKNQFIEVDEFHQTLECMGFMITEEQVFELMRQMDENFDGRISYNELKTHILRLGFTLDKTLESRVPAGAQQQMTTFQWRDKGLELIIQALHKKLDGQTYEDFLRSFDHDYDGHLTPSEFRMALLSLKENQLGRPQIERVLHILLEEKKSKPLVAIERMASFLRSYKCLDEGAAGGSGALLIDEDLFVYIVERYDGFSRLVEQFTAVEERAQYISRHTHEINLHGLDMLANQMNLAKIHRRAKAVNGLYEATLILLAGEANRLIRDEAQLCVLDPTSNINTIVSDAKIGTLAAVSVPNIENSLFEADFATEILLPSGARKYEAFMAKQRKRAEVYVYPDDILTVVSPDGRQFKRHLGLELELHRYLMGAIHDDEDELDPEIADIFPMIGKFEKSSGLAASGPEISVVTELINGDEWINLDDFVGKNGGILNIPLFYHTDAPLFIIRHWAQMILKIIEKVHDVSVVLRCLNLRQIWVSRDGQKIKLGHVRGVGRVNTQGYLDSCPAIQLHLDNPADDRRAGRSSTQSPPQKLGGAASSSKKTDGGRHFSNSCLDNPFIAPETIFLKFMDQSSALDVWSFGMIMYCLLLGKKPQSFYAVYREWYKKCHGQDVEMLSMPFTPPSQSNFLYDPFAIDIENPFDGDDEEWDSSAMLDIPGSLKEKRGSINFENFIKCLKDMSYSSLFTQENSKKFHFKSVAEQFEATGGMPGNKGSQGPRFPGQQVTQQETRLKALHTFAKAGVLARKNELGLILDLISSCLDMDPKRRPSIKGLSRSPLFQLDSFELTKAVRFSQNVILYRSPTSTVSMRITGPLRGMCTHAIKSPERLMHLEEDILRMFLATEESVAHLSSLPLDEINEVLTEKEKRRALNDQGRASAFRGKDFSRLRVSPNSPLAAQIIEDKVIDMLIFLTFRFTKTFHQWKTRAASDVESQSPSRNPGGAASQTQGTRRSQSVRFGGDGATQATERTLSQNQQAILKGQSKRVQNHVLQRMTRLLKTLVYEMHSYSTPMAPYVKEVVEYVIKLYVGEEYELGSDCVLRKTAGQDSTIKDYLRNRSFFKKEGDLGESFKSDFADKAWHLEQRNLSFLDKSNHWSVELHQEANKIYKDAITESGMGQSCYPVLNDYIANVTNSLEPSKIFSKQMNQLSLSFLIPMNRTTAYYNELTPITDCLNRLYSPDLEKAGKRCALAMIRSVFQTGSSDKIKACLDMRVPKHIIHFLQDTDSEVRKECLQTLLEISKGLQDDDFEIIGKSAANLKQEYSRRGFKKTAFDQHKAISMASQSEAVEAGDQDQDAPMGGAGAGRSKKNQPIPQATTDGYSNYIKRTIALIEKNENERFINFALDLPNLNFLASKRFLREMAVCFESPVFIAPLTRLLKTKSETFSNKEIILKIAENLFCGNERVLTALNSPASDTYMTLLRLLMQSTKTANARSNPSGLTAQMRNHLLLQDSAVGLFKFMFEQRRPTILRDLGCIGASSTLLREQGLKLPELISLPIIVAAFERVEERAAMEGELRPDMINMDEFTLVIKDLQCWIKHFYEQSSIPELTKMKALQRCSSFLVKVVALIWDDYRNVDPEKRLESLSFIKISLQLFDWLCVTGKEGLLFNDECGRENLRFMIERCTIALAQFRAPQEHTQLPLEDLTFNTKKNKQTQATRKYDMFPFTEIGAILQHVLYQLVRKDTRYLNRLLSEANFGFIFGEHLLLEYDFIRHCIDNKIESMVLIDSYVKKNEIRLNTYEYILRCNEPTLKDQLLTSAFIDKMFEDYICDFREFNIQFSKIDLEFLAFRRSYPIRLECISIVNTTLMLKSDAPRVFTELVTYARRHFLIKQELDLLRRGRIGTKESTALLLFAIILESNEEDLIHVMMQEGVAEILKALIRDHPSLKRKFPILAAFTSPF